MDVHSLPTEFYSAYVFDMDGTIYLGDHLLPGAARMIEELRRRNIPVRFLSNNPTKDPEMYAEKLDRLGIQTPVDDIANTIVTTTRWLKHHAPDAVLFVVGEEPLKRALALDPRGFELLVLRLLAELMLRHGVGVQAKTSVTLYDLDEDFFEEL